MVEARVKIEFHEATQEGFEVFSDEVAAELPDVDVTYHDKPIFGRPYIMVKHASKVSPWDSWTLCVDEGETLCVADQRYWVERPDV